MSFVCSLFLLLALESISIKLGLRDLKKTERLTVAIRKLKLLLQLLKMEMEILMRFSIEAVSDNSINYFFSTESFRLIGEKKNLSLKTNLILFTFSISNIFQIII